MPNLSHVNKSTLRTTTIKWPLASALFLMSTACSGDEGDSTGSGGSGGRGGETGLGSSSLCDSDGVVRGETVELTTQIEVQTLAGCTELEGELLIHGSGIVDLQPLAALTTIGRNISVTETTSLESLAGLEALGEVGWAIEIEDNELLSSLKGLSGLKVGAALTIRGNPQLESLIGLEALTTLSSDEEEVGSSLLIHDNPRLASLEGLSALDVQGGHLNVSIADNESLQDISALNDFEALRSLLLRNNPLLETLPRFNELVSASITIENSDLSSLDAFSALREAEYIGIEGNESLSDLSGFESLQSVSKLHVVNNSSLNSFGELPRLKSIQVLRVRGNDSLSSLGTWGNELNPMETLQLVDCPLLFDLSALSSLTGVEDVFHLEGLSDLENLAALSSLKSVGDELIVINNQSLDQDSAFSWAESQNADWTKVDGNLGAMPHEGECPWDDDGYCDEAEGTGLCQPESDSDCRKQGG